MKNIGLDLDNTLMELDTISIINREFKTKYTYLDCDNWSLLNFPENIRKRMLEIWNDPEHMCNLKPYPVVIPTLTVMKELGHKLYIITARNKPVREKTLEMIERELPGLIDNVFFVNHNESKQSIRESLNITEWIDDAPMEVQMAAYSGIKTYMVSNEITQYNWYLRNWKYINVMPNIRYYWNFQ